jgi:ribose transport system substrate-binding protein
MPFSVEVSASITAAAAAAGVELVPLDNRYDADVAIKNAEEFARQRVDLALEFQVEEHVAPHVAHIFKKAEIPLIAIDVPHPNATYFGVDNFEVGHEAGVLLAKYAMSEWGGSADWVLGIGFSEAGSFVQSRIAGAFEGIRERLGGISADRFVRLDGRGMRRPSFVAASEFMGQHRGERILVAAATDSSALGVLDAAREAGSEQHVAIVGQDCIPEALSEIQKSNSALIGSISHGAETYGPRLIQLGIALLRGHAVPPYNYVRHHAVTRETLAEEGAKNAKAASRKTEPVVSNE